MSPSSSTIEVVAGDVVVVGEERLTITAPAKLVGTPKPKVPRQGGGPVQLECAEGCARGEDGRAFHVLMGRKRFEQWGPPLCRFCKQRLVPRTEL
jgi:hypothetical protein